jgi:hypothetical protein
MDYVQLTTYVVAFLLLIVIVYGMIRNLVCDCKECGFFNKVSGDPHDKITQLLRPFAFTNIWPFCYLAAIILTYVFATFYPMLSVVPPGTDYGWLINQGVIFIIIFALTAVMFGFIQYTYLDPLTDIIISAYDK